MKYIKLYDSTSDATGQTVSTPFVSAIETTASGASLVYAPESLGDTVTLSVDPSTNEIIPTIQETDLSTGFVDLGLTSGTKWASCNLGAESPCEYGDYYMWGSTEPATVCTWETTPFNDDVSSYNEEYFVSVKDTVCPGGVLAAEYDAAQIAGMGKMPTKAQLQELTSECTLTWGTCATLGGDHSDHTVAGVIVTGPNGNMIFLPAAGCIDVTGPGGDGTIMFVWSSTLEESEDQAFCISNVVGQEIESGGQRHFGFSIRPVQA